MLELPIEADGKPAVCPACQTQFVAAAMGNAIESQVRHEVPLPAPSAETSKVYQRVSIETVLEDTRSVFHERRRPFLLPFLVPTVLAAVGLLPLVYLSDLAVTKRMLAMIWLAVLSPWFLLVISYPIWFAFRLSQNLCDPGPENPPDCDSGGDTNVLKSYWHWFAPDGRTFLSLLLLVTITLVFLMALVVISTTMINLAVKVQAPEIRVLLSIIAFAMFVVCWLLVGTRFWPLYPLVMRMGFGSQAIRESLAITRVNLMTSFLLVTTIFFFLGIGFGVFGLGLPLAIPLAALATEVASRLIEGRRIATLVPNEG
jgi:hypothetical protein